MLPDLARQAYQFGHTHVQVVHTITGRDFYLRNGYIPIDGVKGFAMRQRLGDQMPCEV